MRSQRVRASSMNTSYIMDQSGLKRAWTEEEDSILRGLIEANGIGKWTSIANSLPGRSGKQCRERWHNHLSPDVKKGEWDDEEDALIVGLQAKYGNLWSQFTPFLSGRTDNSIKNRFHVLQRAMKSGSKVIDFDQVDIPDIVQASPILPKAPQLTKAQQQQYKMQQIQEINNHQLAQQQSYENGTMNDNFTNAIRNDSYAFGFDTGESNVAMSAPAATGRLDRNSLDAINQYHMANLHQMHHTIGMGMPVSNGAFDRPEGYINGNTNILYDEDGIPPALSTESSLGLSNVTDSSLGISPRGSVGNNDLVGQQTMDTESIGTFDPQDSTMETYLLSRQNSRLSNSGKWSSGGKSSKAGSPRDSISSGARSRNSSMSIDSNKSMYTDSSLKSFGSDGGISSKASSSKTNNSMGSRRSSGQGMDHEAAEVIASLSSPSPVQVNEDLEDGATSMASEEDEATTKNERKNFIQNVFNFNALGFRKKNSDK
jgi:hypothetical protein